MAEKVFADGIYFYKKRESAPDFVIGTISFHPERFVEWIGRQEKDERGYIRLSVLDGKDGKPYIQLDTWKPSIKLEPETDGPKTNGMLDKEPVNYPKGPAQEIPF